MKIELQKESWYKYGTDYDNDPVFQSARKGKEAYEDKDRINHYSLGREEELQLHWWEKQDPDLSDWRRNYMRTLELRTLNTKRVLKLNIKNDIERANDIEKATAQNSIEHTARQSKMSKILQGNRGHLSQLRIRKQTSPLIKTNHTPGYETPKDEGSIADNRSEMPVWDGPLDDIETRKLADIRLKEIF